MNFDLIHSQLALSDHSDQLKTAILLSLYCDARATKDEFEQVKDWEKSKRGYWAEQLLGQSVGSKLWLLKRSPKSQDTLERAKAYSKEALQWLVEANQIKQVDVSAGFENEILHLEIKIDGKEYKVQLNG